MSKYRFALVSWAEGPDKDQTSIIPISWIIDFDPADTDKKYFVECRSTNQKKPASGWPVEHAVVLQLAEKEATLRAAERELYPEDMAGKRVRKAKCLDFGEEDTTSTGNKASGSGNPKQKKAKVAAQRRAEEELLSEDRAELSSQESDLTRDLQSQIKALQKENAKLRNMVVKEIPGLLVGVRKLVSINNPTTKDVVDPDAESDGPGETSLYTPCRPSQSVSDQMVDQHQEMMSAALIVSGDQDTQMTPRDISLD
ncbi:uncharacterized protein LOC131538834 isoform X2 [Onychostoma macrolepis]|uniref:Uncharacterized protein n=1 Tax=Onychostoma macrolepis TaxID=369639 RepID=A0A7J6DGR3_9TELE|nr:uncharacterized protein LOC131538834 isoform X2 [Onychostoma macrolepis]KAF4117974.1 hypothetical protein G5714_000025 [Onychostoma macrolepis]